MYEFFTEANQGSPKLTEHGKKNKDLSLVHHNKKKKSFCDNVGQCKRIEKAKLQPRPVALFTSKVFKLSLVERLLLFIALFIDV